MSVAGYWPQQFDARYDYSTDINDTVRLMRDVPWYNFSSDALMESGSTNQYQLNPNVNGYVQHVLGQRQYELTNHLGNPAKRTGQVVQATISDKRFVGWDDANGNTYLSASVPAQYDYYPYGMPIKERTMRDNTIQSTWMSQTYSVPIYSNQSNVMAGATGTGNNAVPYSNNSFTVGNAQGYASKYLTNLVIGKAVKIKFYISTLCQGAEINLKEFSRKKDF